MRPSSGTSSPVSSWRSVRTSSVSRRGSGSSARARCRTAPAPLAERLGDQAIAPEEAAAVVGDATAELGADVVIEAAGSPGALDLALRLTRGRGLISVVGAHFEPDYPLDNALMFERELTLPFTIGDPAPDRDQLLASIAAGRLDPAPIGTHRLPLGAAPEAYRPFDPPEAP